MGKNYDCDMLEHIPDIVIDDSFFEAVKILAKVAESCGMEFLNKLSEAFNRKYDRKEGENPFTTGKPVCIVADNPVIGDYLEFDDVILVSAEYLMENF
ncbi:MAG: hypothetical protein ACYC0Q_06025 [Eubacteriales bacterium]